MALHLKRVTNFQDYLRCTVTQEIIAYGDMYYIDDEKKDYWGQPVIMKASVYDNFKTQRLWDRWDMSKLNNAESQRDYMFSMRQIERDYLTQTILDQPLFHKVADSGDEVKNI